MITRYLPSPVGKDAWNGRSNQCRQGRQLAVNSISSTLPVSRRSPEAIMDSAPASSAPRAPVNIPPIHPRPLDSYTSDFVRQQVAKQQHSNYHSTSLRTMVSTSVNRTALHPTGVQYVLPVPVPVSFFCYLVHLLQNLVPAGIVVDVCEIARREFFFPEIYEHAAACYIGTMTIIIPTQIHTARL